MISKEQAISNQKQYYKNIIGGKVQKQIEEAIIKSSKRGHSDTYIVIKDEVVLSDKLYLTNTSTGEKSEEYGWGKKSGEMLSGIVKPFKELGFKIGLVWHTNPNRFKQEYIKNIKIHISWEDKE